MRLELPWLMLLLFAAVSSAHADSYRMGVIDIEQLAAGEFRVVQQFSKGSTAARLRRPAACQQATTQRSQPLAQGARISVNWLCAEDLSSLPLSLDQPLPEGTQYYLSWRASDWQLQSVPVTHWPLVAQRLRDTPLPQPQLNYLWMGITHILQGWDHLAFVLGLLALVQAWRRLVAVISAFTLGHSLTLALSTFDLLRVSTAYVEVLIALSIVYLIAEAVRPHSGSLLRRAPVSVAAFFGLFHGLGFASALREVGVADDGRVWSLLQFNLGVELGQLAFVVVVFPLMALSQRRRWSGVQLPALRLLGVSAGFWTAERLTALLS